MREGFFPMWEGFFPMWEGFFPMWEGFFPMWEGHRVPRQPLRIAAHGAPPTFC